jgi:hypothetical protein
VNVIEPMEYPRLPGLLLLVYMSSKFPYLLGLMLVTLMVLSCLKLFEFDKLKSVYKGTHGFFF